MEELGDMRSKYHPDNSGHSSLICSKLIGYVFLFLSVFSFDSDLTNVFISKACKMHLRSTSIASSFCHFITLVFKVGSNPEMIWINAMSYIARMTNAHSFWNFCFIVKFPRITMCGCRLPVDLYVSVPASRSRTLPKPAGISLYETKKKFRLMSKKAFPAKMLSRPFHCACFPLNLSATAIASYCNHRTKYA